MVHGILLAVQSKYHGELASSVFPCVTTPPSTSPPTSLSLRFLGPLGGDLRVSVLRVVAVKFPKLHRVHGHARPHHDRRPSHRAHALRSVPFSTYRLAQAALVLLPGGEGVRHLGNHVPGAERIMEYAGEGGGGGVMS